MNHRENSGMLFILGLVAGFVAGILIAPKSGEETRKIIKEKANEYSKKGKKIIEEEKNNIKKMAKSVTKSFKE